MKILIVEDNRDLVQVLSEGFNDLNYSVESAFDGIEGLNKIRNSDYDCIILDIMLPEMDGYEVVERAREEGKDTPVIMLTAKDSIEDRVEGLNRGADDYLVKPFDFRELVARINAVTRRRAELKRPILNCGPLVLDPIARECRPKARQCLSGEGSSTSWSFLCATRTRSSPGRGSLHTYGRRSTTGQATWSTFM